ncbi:MULTISPECIES: amidohydrolase family protein [Amycolatopsis]|uniref:Amidohydrolase family protein n=1 Tax=Amycolatopsis tucumanensis TaxID=401106 RepID=A0ABP7HXU2_9PSEU|nr:amidohydrolase family protein [Amycolatopsis tucumanensis]MCF6428659.1 amidohydrolase family protein [Amycolatopsis tucumanensis]
MIIDAHSHVHDPVEKHLTLLDEAGVDKAILFATRPHPERAMTLDELKAEMAVLSQSLAGSGDGRAAALRELDDAVAAHPDRFLGFGSVDLSGPDVAAAVEETGRMWHGIGELTPPPGRADLLEPVLRAADGLPVVVHGAAPTTADDLATIGALARKYPWTPLVISQLGGTHWIDAIELVRETPNLWLELSTASLVFSVRLAIAEVPDRTLFGSDAPYGDPALARALVERVTPSETVRAAVLGGNAARLLGP